MGVKRKIPVGFLGYGTRALDALMESELFEVKYFFAPEARLCADVYEAAEKYSDSLELVVVKNNAELAKRLETIKDVECFVMNACNIILKEEVLSKMPFYNVHPGRLENNRGHHPHLWTVLLGEPTSEIVLHSVSTGIDEGGVVAFCDVEIPSDANSLQVLDLLEDRIPELLEGLYRHITEGTPFAKSVSGGNYRHTMIPDDYKVDFANANEPWFDLDLSRKIRARFMHHGAFFVDSGKRIYVDRVLSREETEADSGLCVEFAPDDLVRIDSKGICYTCHINKIQEDKQ